MRNDESFHHTYSYIQSVAALNGTEEVFEDNTRRKRKLPNRLQKSVLHDTIGHRETLSCKDSIKINIYYPAFDHILSEMESRFSNSNLDLMRAVDACNPSSCNFLDSSLLIKLGSLYGIETKDLQSECMLARPILKEAALENILAVYTHILKFSLAFPTMKKLLHVALTLVVSTAQCERSFSALRRIKNHMRTTMTNDRLADISLLSLERDLCSTFTEDTLCEFEGFDKNRTIVLS